MREDRSRISGRSSAATPVPVPRARRSLPAAPIRSARGAHRPSCRPGPDRRAGRNAVAIRSHGGASSRPSPRRRLGQDGGIMAIVDALFEAGRVCRLRRLTASDRSNGRARREPTQPSSCQRVTRCAARGTSLRSWSPDRGTRPGRRPARSAASAAVGRAPSGRTRYRAAAVCGCACARGP